MLDFYMPENAVDEIGYELANHPNWAPIPLGGVIDILQRRRERNHEAGR